MNPDALYRFSDFFHFFRLIVIFRLGPPLPLPIPFPVKLFTPPRGRMDLLNLCNFDLPASSSLAFPKLASRCLFEGGIASDKLSSTGARQYLNMPRNFAIFAPPFPSRLPAKVIFLHPSHPLTLSPSVVLVVLLSSTEHGSPEE